jgi:hypothetical protein
MNNLLDKIEEIRNQPEHIRLRWAWGLTVSAMVLIVIIWMISFSAQKSESDEKNLNNNEIIQELSTQKQSIKDATNQIKNGLNK